jgi:phosphoribosylformimino-5-aminoimidazole carboxamide ribotide isomerase
MEIIPVLDLLGGVVVRGVGGRRDEYRPIQSLLTTDPSPTAVLDAILDQFKIRTIYVADLDAIIHGELNFTSISELARRPVELLIDAGMTSFSQALTLVDVGVGRIIAASESLSDFQLLKDLVERFSAKSIVFSMDMKAGAPIVAADEWKTLAPFGIVMEAAEAGVTQFVLLDLADVGEANGIRTLPLLSRLRKELPTCWFAVGGGVGSMDDVFAAEQAGADAVLVASALHDGRIVGDRNPPNRPTEKVVQ